MPWVSRMHLATGAVAYLASMLWAATLLVGMILAVQSKLMLPDYFGDEPSLFPNWPQFDPEAALPLLGWTMLVVFAPKLLGLLNAWLVVRRSTAQNFKIATAALIELVYSALSAPILMASQTSAVLHILARRDGGWPAQQRTGAALTIAQTLGAHRGKTLLGLALLICAAAVSPAMAAWMLPVGLGFILAPVTDWWTSRAPGPSLDRLLAFPPAPERMPSEVERRTVLWRSLLSSLRI